MIPSQRTKKFAVSKTVSQYYCKLFLAPIFRPVIRIIREFVSRRKISAVRDLSDQEAGFVNFVSGIDDVNLFDVGYNHWSAWAARPAEH